MHVFISHISEESDLALCLKDWMESTFLGQCEVFVSSDCATLPGGSKWLDEISKALKQTKVLIVLCSSASLPRPWVNFETGCGWARDIPIIPVCHTGVSRGALPRPLSEFQAIDLSDSEFVNLFFSALIKHFGMSKAPRVDAEAMRKDLMKAISSSAVTSVNNADQQLENAVSLRDEGWKILHFLSQQLRPISIDQIAAGLGHPHQRTQFFIDELGKAHLIYVFLNMMSGTSYALNDKGRKLLFDQGLL